jgi:uncharacterized membrane protein
MTTTNDALVDDYLARVARATAGLSPERRDELIHDLREHIETGRAELTDESEVGVREILERLGDPEMIAREARQDGEAVPVVGFTPPRRSRATLWIILAVVIVLAVVVLCIGTTLASHTGVEMGRPG